MNFDARALSEVGPEGQKLLASLGGVRGGLYPHRRPRSDRHRRGVGPGRGRTRTAPVLAAQIEALQAGWRRERSSWWRASRGERLPQDPGREEECRGGGGEQALLRWRVSLRVRLGVFPEELVMARGHGKGPGRLSCRRWPDASFSCRWRHAPSSGAPTPANGGGPAPTTAGLGDGRGLLPGCRPAGRGSGGRRGPLRRRRPDLHRAPPPGGKSRRAVGSLPGRHWNGKPPSQGMELGESQVEFPGPGTALVLNRYVEDGAPAGGSRGPGDHRDGAPGRGVADPASAPLLPPSTGIRP